MTIDEAANILNVKKSALGEESELQKMLKVSARPMDRGTERTDLPSSGSGKLTLTFIRYACHSLEL
jgi:hypothetical protein